MTEGKEIDGITEETNESVQEVGAGQETTTTQEEKEQATEQAKPANDEHLERVKNWRMLREKAERAERERDEVLARLKQHEQAIKPQSQEESLNDDDLLEGKHLKNFEIKQAERLSLLEQKLIESQLKTQYADFDKVVNADTLGMLRDADPELAESIASNPNLHSKAVAAYNSIKRYGLYGEDRYMKDKEKALGNSSKPRPTSSISPQQGDTPLSHANAFSEGLTPELSKQLWKEMQEARKKS